MIHSDLRTMNNDPELQINNTNWVRIAMRMKKWNIMN